MINVITGQTEHMTVDRPCPFCQPSEDLNARIIYRSDGWLAVLAAPPNLHGHTVLARAVQRGERCPRELDIQSVRGLDEAIAAVVPILERHYLPTHVVFGSLRLIDRHFHLHLFPVTAPMEQEWRSLMGKGYEAGRFFEFLGHHERVANERDALERAETGISSIDQRLAWTERLKPEVGRLRQLAAGSVSESA